MARRPSGLIRSPYYRAAYTRAWTLIEDAAEVLDNLRGRGLRTAILTNYVQEVQLEELAFFGLTAAVDAVLCVEDIPAPKPDACAYHAACAALDVASAETVVVGDSWANDVDGALKAGLRAIWFNREGRAAPVAEVPQVQRLAELARWL